MVGQHSAKTSERYVEYPPEPDRLQPFLDDLVSTIKDYQITHGSLIKLVWQEQKSTVPAQPVGAAIFPTQFPRHCFEEACDIQKLLNKLYVAVSEDDEWLERVLSDLIQNDGLIKILWSIHKTVKQEGLSQDLTMGIFRSDYMLHQPDIGNSDFTTSCIKQVECNHYFVAGGIHGNIVADMHRHLQRTGAYDCVGNSTETVESSMPVNKTLGFITDGLMNAHQAYGPPRSTHATQTCILYVVQPRNFNICDERPIEYKLWDRGIPTFRIHWGQDILDQTYLSDTKELIYTPRSRGKKDRYEVSVVYMRAAHNLFEFDQIGQSARLQLERSRAIKCPSIACHLTTLKRVQQALTKDGQLARFLPIEEAVRVKQIFMPMYCLDESVDGHRMRRVATDPISCMNYVLKPNLEGGGNNIYRENIAPFLAKIDPKRWSQYILMELIRPPPLINYLMMPQELYHGPVVSELGIFGICMWRRHTGHAEGDPLQKEVHITKNEQGGWSLKTKKSEVDEMSVVKGTHLLGHLIGLRVG